MQERDKLFELIDESLGMYITDDKYGKDKECVAAIIESAAEYLLENGVIVPPVKIGDTVYRIFDDGEDVIIEELKVVEVSSKRFWIDKKTFFSFEEFDKTLFHNRQKAEKALKEWKKC